MHISIYRFTKNTGNFSVLHSGQNVPVSSFGIRSKNVATGVHKSSVCTSRIPENAKFEISSLPRRLVSTECSQKQVSGSQGFSTQSKTRLGFTVNREKSQLQPSQQIVYIGGFFQFFPTSDRIEK